MIQREILELLAKRPPPGSQCAFERERIAAAALLVECAQADTDFALQEHEAVWAALRWQLGLDDRTCQAMMAGADRGSAEGWPDWPFLEAIKRGFTLHEQLAILERLWEVAHAWGHAHPFEVHLISRAARELGISHAVLEETRFRTQERLAGGPQAPQP